MSKSSDWALYKSPITLSVKASGNVGIALLMGDPHFLYIFRLLASIE